MKVLHKTIVDRFLGLIIGFIGGLFACLLSDLMERLKIDDPANCVATHAGSGAWGMIAVALFVEQDNLEGFTRVNGILKGGSWHLLGVQLCAVVSTGGWAVVTTLIELYVIEKTIGIRLNLEEELQGCDFVEHGISMSVKPPVQKDRKDTDKKNVIEEMGSTRTIVKENEGHEQEETIPHNSLSTVDASQDIEELIRREIENLAEDQTSNVFQKRNTADKGVQVDPIIC